MRRTAFALACLAGLAHAETRPRYAGKIEGSLLGAPAVLDPVHAHSHAELTVVGFVFDTLYRVELSGAVTPRIAAGPPEQGGKGSTRIPIRKGVKFHDGSVLVPGDIVASLERARTGGGKWALAPIASVKADADAIEIVLKAPVDVATMLALAPSAITRGGKAPGAKPIGTGPFEIKTLDRSKRRLVLEAFEDHFAGRTYLDRVVLHWHDDPLLEAKHFETGALQLSARGPTGFTSGQPKYRAGAVDGPTSLLIYVGFGRKHAAVLRDTAFRRALDFALERNALVSVNKGERVMPAGDPVPVEAGAPPPSALVRSGDLSLAKAALADAAKRVPVLAKPSQLTLEIAFEDTRPDDREIAERVGRALGKLGIRATLAAMSAVELGDRVRRGNVDLHIGQLAVPLRAGWAWWSAAFTAGGDDWATTRLAAGQLRMEAARREHATRRPILPLMFRGVRMWHRSDLRGLRFDVLGRPCLEEMFVFGVPVRTGTP